MESQSNIETELTSALNRFTSMIESNPSMLDISFDNIFSYLNEILGFPRSEPILLASIKLILATINANPVNCFKLIDIGIYNKLLTLMNPSDVYPKISIKVATVVRDIIARMGSYDKVLQNPKFSYLKYDLFLDKIYQFPLVEQKNIIEFTRKLSNTYIYDYYLPPIIEICPLLTHFDLQIVIDSVQIISNYVKRANLDQLKIIDPIITQKISIALLSITDDQCIFSLLCLLDKFCQVSYEYAESLIYLPIDLGQIIDHLGTDPRVDALQEILNIINQVFTFQTLRKSDRRNEKVSKFAFYVQPILIRLLSLNSCDSNQILDCLSVTLDAYFPLHEINTILDSIVHIISSGNKHLKIDTFYKKIFENRRIKDGMNEYEKHNLPHQTFIPHLIDFNTFNDIEKVHSSTFALSEPLQNSILYFLKGINHSIDLTLMKETLLKIVDFCQKTIIFNTPKPGQKYASQIIRQSTPQMISITIYNSARQMLNIRIPECVNLSIFEAFFNYVSILSNQENANLQQLPRISIEQLNAYISINNVNNYIEIDLLDDMIISVLNHALCYKPNELLLISRSINPFLSNPQINPINQLINNHLFDYKFYKIKADGKEYSIYDNVFQILKQTKTNHFEMIEIQKSSDSRKVNFCESDFFNRKDIIHPSSTKLINFNAFHESFIYAYPTLNLQRKAFDYYSKAPINHIEKSLQILKEIHRLMPDLKNGLNENAFINDILAQRLLEKIGFTDFNPVTTSAFINFPFIFSLENRLIFLKLSSMTFFHLIFIMANKVLLNTENHFSPFQRIGITIDRNKLFSDGLTVFNLLSAGGISFNVKFAGESGTGIGPTQEFFRLFALQLQMNWLDIWLSDKQQSDDKTAKSSNTESSSNKTSEKVDENRSQTTINSATESSKNSAENTETSSTESSKASTENAQANNDETPKTSTETNNDETSNNNENIEAVSSSENQQRNSQRQFFSTFNSLLAHREGESGLFPSPLSVRRPDLFFTLGSLCAKAIELDIVLPLRFSPAFISLVRGEKISIEDVSTSYASALKQPDKSGLIGLPFTLPGRPDIELRKGGSQITTDEGNVDLYAELLKRVLTFDVHTKSGLTEKVEKTVDEAEISPLTPKSSNAWSPSLQRAMSTTLTENSALSPLSSNNNGHPLLAASESSPQISEETIISNSKSSNSEGNENEFVEVPLEIETFIERYSFDCCAAMFREGFGRVIPWNSMNIFSADEFCQILAGDEDLSIDSLRNFVDYGSEMNSDSSIVEWLFEIVSEELSKSEKKLFARFITGSDNFGIFGLRSLNPRLTISKSTKGENALPSASTCTHTLKLPEYSSKKLLKEKLLYALYECNETFYS